MHTYETNPNAVGQLFKDNKILKLNDFRKCKSCTMYQRFFQKEGQENISVAKFTLYFINQNHV